METRPYLLHALSPLHAGIGQSVAAIDLPIARMKGTNLPFLPGSSIKGVLREERLPENPTPEQTAQHNAVFGPPRDSVGEDGDNASLYQGALSVSDARLLLLPVRSFRRVFAYVTSPLLLRLAQRDVPALGMLKTPSFSKSDPAAQVPPGESWVVHSDSKVYLEDQDLPAVATKDAGDFAQALAQALGLGDELARRFVIVDDETMGFLYETATQIDTRVSIDPETGVARDGQLWTEESLPAESVLVGVLYGQDTVIRKTKKEVNASKEPLNATAVLDFALPKTPKDRPETLQFGGKATVGRGRCNLIVWS